MKRALLRDDPRPLWVCGWGGMSVLAQALWDLERELRPADFDAVLGKLRIHSISDQDFSGPWMRRCYGERLFYIVTPSQPDSSGTKDYWRAAWPGISADRNAHGSEDGIRRTKGFSGADFDLVSKGWVRTYVRSVSPLGRLYPQTRFILEGDTPSYLGFISNGLNCSEYPDFGGWGGRYEWRVPDGEDHAVWTASPDEVMGVDGLRHRSPQATIWRWRGDFQNDFAARMAWTSTADRAACCHPPVVDGTGQARSVLPGQEVPIGVTVQDPDGHGFDSHWFCYPEAGACGISASVLPGEDGQSALVRIPEGSPPGTVHIVCAVTGRSSIPLTRYCRFVLEVRFQGA